MSAEGPFRPSGRGSGDRQTVGAWSQVQASLVPAPPTCLFTLLLFCSVLPRGHGGELGPACAFLRGGFLGSFAPRHPPRTTRCCWRCR